MKLIAPELLQKYFENRCSETEREEVEAWLYNEDRLVSDELPVLPFYDSAREVQLLDSILAKKRVESRKAITKIYRVIAVAAMLLLVAGSIWLSYEARNAHNAAHARQTATERKWRQYSAPAGSRKQILLQDSTVVYLMGGTGIRFPEALTGNSRDLLLDSGEIFLEVAHQADRPFLVHSEGTRVRVLGTRFNVRNRLRDRNITVALLEGSIEFTAPGVQAKKLKPGNEVVYNTATRTLLQRGNVPDAAIGGWVQGTLAFNNAPLQKVFERLADFYGINIRVESKKILNRKLTGTFDNLSVKAALDAVSFTTSLQYRQNGNEVLIY